MSSAVNKRQQVRNERALQDLIRNVPGNDRCADCAAKNPGWASWSLGIFLCMRCAALHRKLGTHISKVKSLSMDSWSVDQVENMKRIGNTTSNRTFNPKNVKPAIPIDVDEVDGVMERFIRQKYEQKSISSDTSAASRHHTGSTSSDDRPPPLPPKPSRGTKFSLRSATANFPLHRQERSPPISPVIESYGSRLADSPRNKPAKIFGAEIGGSRDDNIKVKLAQLREMGFVDEKRNFTVLKGLNGNLDRAVEELIRLGEGGSIAGPRSSSTSQQISPVRGGSNGLVVEKSRPSPVNIGRTPSGLNGADTQKSLPPSPNSTQDSATIRSMDAAMSPNNPFNPFLQQQQQQPPHSARSQPPLDQAFQNMSLAHQPLQPPQPLFPHSTGGYGHQAPGGHNPFLQTYTPPPMPNQYSTFINPPFAPPVQAFDAFQPAPAVQQSTFGEAANPFLRTSKSQVFTPSTNPFGAPQSHGVQSVQPLSQIATFSHDTHQVSQNTQVAPSWNQTSGSNSSFAVQTPTATSASNPFQQSLQQQSVQKSPFQQQASSYQQTAQVPQAPVTSPFAQPVSSPFSQPASSPFAPTTTQTPQPFQSNAYPFSQPGNIVAQQPDQSYQQSFPLPQTTTSPPPILPQSTASPFGPPRHDKSSILALYNMPQLAPQRFDGSTPIDQNGLQQPQSVPQRSVTMPAAMPVQGQENGAALAKHNPFATFAPQQQQQQQQPQFVASAIPPAMQQQQNGYAHISRESMAFTSLGQSGRVSPDAFAGLSSRMR